MRRPDSTKRRRRGGRSDLRTAIGHLLAPWRDWKSWMDGLDWAADVALVGIIFIAPLVMGGRNPLGRVVYLVLVFVFAAAWLSSRWARRELHLLSSGTGWLMACALLLVLLQVVHLPRALVQLASAYQAELIPPWTGAASSRLGLPTWDQVSLAPIATWRGLAMLLAHAVFFTILLQKLRQLPDVERLLKWIAGSVLLISVLSLVQYLTGTDKFVWVFEHQSRPAHLVVSGPFANSNHFAHFLALGIGPILWWFQRRREVERSGPTGNTFRDETMRDKEQLKVLLAAFALAVVSLSGLLTQSRGGILMMLLAAVLSFGLFIASGMFARRALWLLGGISVLVVSALLIHGLQGVEKELGTLADGSLDALDAGAGRRKIWAANLQVARHFPVLGAGVGTHGEIYQRFFPHASLVEFTHAESGYLQVLTETGIPGVGLLAIAIGFLVCWAWRGLRYGLTPRAQACAMAVIPGLAVSLIHSIFDFPWYLPSCMALALMLAACICRLHQLTRDDNRGRRFRVAISSRAWSLGTLCVLAALLLFIGDHVRAARAAPHWVRYLKLSLQSERQFRPPQGVLAAGSQDAQRRQRAALEEHTRRMAVHLEEVLRRDADHLRAHTRMAAVCLRLFELSQQNSVNAMGLAAVRGAALASNFQSRSELMEWLNNAVGPDLLLLEKSLYHCRRGLRLCPLQADGYLYLAELGFLNGLGAKDSAQLIARAERTRPHDPAVLFTLGRDAALAGNSPATLDYWSKSFHLSREYRTAIINNLAGRIPATLFVQQFEPDASGLEALFAFYRRQDQHQQARVVGPLVVEQLQRRATALSGVSAARLWNRARGLNRYLEDPAAALGCAERAVAAAPNLYEARLWLAEELARSEVYDQSIDEYMWCLRRRPYDKTLRQRLDHVKRLHSKQLVRQATLSTPTAEQEH